MAAEAYGRDFWVGAIFRSKDSRDGRRHVVITDIRNGRAKCHNLIAYAKTMHKRGTWIGLKGLATRWVFCNGKDCAFCATRQDAEPTKAGERAAGD